MKQGKKLAAMALALAMSVSLTVPALATDSPAVTNPDSEGTYQTGGTQAVPFTGVIKPTQIKATIPTAVAFDIDPTIDVTAADYSAVASKQTDQVTAPENIQVVNGSDIPIYVSVTSVTVSDGVTLTNAPANLSNSKSVMFGLTNTAPTSSAGLATATDWIVGSGTGGAGDLASPYRIGNSVPAVGTADNGNVLSIYIRAVTLKGWAANDEFVVTPTFVVSATAPTASAS